jgi:hypothetical protein
MTRALIVMLALSGCGDAVAAKMKTMREFARAQKLAETGQFEEPTVVCERIWQDHSLAAAGVQSTALIDQIGKLSRKYPPARERFAKLRDASAPGENPTAEQLGDWMALNDALDENALTLAWFDKAPEKIRANKAYAHLLERNLIPLLIAADRWSDAGKVYQDPVGSLHAEPGFAKGPGILTWTMRHLTNGIQTDRHSVAVGTMLRALRAAGRSEDAAKVAAEAHQLDPSPEMEQALAAAQTP